MKIDWFDGEKYFFTGESVKINWFNSEKYVFTDSISENLTDSDLESIHILCVPLMYLQWNIPWIFFFHKYIVCFISLRLHIISSNIIEKDWISTFSTSARGFWIDKEERDLKGLKIFNTF